LTKVGSDLFETIAVVNVPGDDAQRSGLAVAGNAMQLTRYVHIVNVR